MHNRFKQGYQFIFCLAVLPLALIFAFFIYAWKLGYAITDYATEESPWI